MGWDQLTLWVDRTGHRLTQTAHLSTAAGADTSSPSGSAADAPLPRHAHILGRRRRCRRIQDFQRALSGLVGEGEAPLLGHKTSREGTKSYREITDTRILLGWRPTFHGALSAYRDHFRGHREWMKGGSVPACPWIRLWPTHPISATFTRSDPRRRGKSSIYESVGREAHPDHPQPRHPAAAPDRCWNPARTQPPTLHHPTASATVPVFLCNVITRAAGRSCSEPDGSARASLSRQHLVTVHMDAWGGFLRRQRHISSCAEAAAPA